jgi:hypothetical protein
VKSIIACCPSSVVGAITVAAAIALGGSVAVAFDDVDFGGDDFGDDVGGDLGGGDVDMGGDTIIIGDSVNIIEDGGYYDSPWVDVGVGFVDGMIVNAAMRSRRRLTGYRSSVRNYARTPRPATRTSGAEQRLQQWDGLRPKRLITQAEYEQRRPVIVGGCSVRSASFLMPLCLRRRYTAFAVWVTVSLAAVRIEPNTSFGF